MQKISPYLWFKEGAEEAAAHYVSLFANAKITSTSYYPEASVEVSGKPAGSVMTVEFELEGQRFIALNGGDVPGFTFSPAISLMVSCETQDEIDRLWEGLSAVPEAEQCGWARDKYGVTWQIVPTVLYELLSSGDQVQTERVTAAFLKMKKFNIAALRQAAEQE